MSVNKHRPHILVLPEDEADAEMATGFLLDSRLNEQSIQVLPHAGGWKAVVERFTTKHAPQMRQYPDRWFVLLIDFDKDENRLRYIKTEIPDDIKDRVFVLGALSNPEELKSSLGKKLEAIGESLSANCADNNDELWKHDLLKHNKAELDRMISSVKPFLFNQD